MLLTRHAKCVKECDNGYINYYFKNEARHTIRYHGNICPFCYPLATHNLRRVGSEKRIPAQEFFYLRDRCGWEVETLEDAMHYFRVSPLISLLQ